MMNGAKNVGGGFTEYGYESVTRMIVDRRDIEDEVW